MSIGRKIRSAVISSLEKWLISGQKGVMSSWLWSGSGGYTSSGAWMDEQTALTVGMNMTCVHVASEDLGSVPVHIYRRNPADPDLRQVATEHPLYQVLHSQPNAFQTSMEFREMMAAFVRNWGNAYALMEFDSRFNVRSMVPLMPWQVTAERPGGARGQQMIYTYTDSTGVQERLDTAAVLHVRGLSLDGVKGRSVVQHCAETLGMSQSIAQYGARFFANNARGDLYLMHPGVLKKEAIERLRAQVEERHRGPSNWHRPMVLEEGMEPKALSMPLSDVMMIDALKLTERQICGWHRIPPHKVGINDGSASYASVEQLAIQYVKDVIRPDAERMEQAFQRCCFGPKESREYFVEHNLEGLLRGDLKARYEAYAIGHNTGFMTANTITRRENLPPVQGGDWRILPANTVMIDASGGIVNQPQSTATSGLSGQQGGGGDNR